MKSSDSKTTVLFIWEVREELRNYLINGLKSLSNIDLLFLDNPTKADFERHASEVDIVVGWRPTKQFLEKAEKLSLFINPGAGVQHLLEQFRNLKRRNEIVLVNGHGNSYFTAQHAVALLLSLTNKIIPHHQWLVQGKWRKGDADAKSVPLRFRSVGLLGYGSVNQKVHRFLQGFNVDFSVLKRDWSHERVSSYPTKIDKFTSSELNDFLAAIDTLIIAVPQTKETTGLIGEKELSLLGSDAFIVNMSRGPVIKEKDFYYALKNRVIAGAAIDVWYNYQPKPSDNGFTFPSKYPFYELDNVVLSPHRGASPMDDLKRWDEVIENITRFHQGRKDFLNVVKLSRGY
jgi:phosphoglycerate dehydrogenase-like enzyme